MRMAYPGLRGRPRCADHSTRFMIDYLTRRKPEVGTSATAIGRPSDSACSASGSARVHKSRNILMASLLLRPRGPQCSAAQRSGSRRPSQSTRVARSAQRAARAVQTGALLIFRVRQYIAGAGRAGPARCRHGAALSPPPQLMTPYPAPPCANRNPRLIGNDIRWIRKVLIGFYL